MNCSPAIAIALLLLSLSAGMLLLYKTKKESLGIFFKTVSWFIIVVSVCSMLCCAMRCIVHRCMKKQGCSEMQNCSMGMREFGMGHGGMNKRVMIFKGDRGECQHMMSNCCRENMECGEGKEECMGEEMKCCEKDSVHACAMDAKIKSEVKKDTVVAKKK